MNNPKSMVFRIPAEVKKPMQIAMIKNGTRIQDMFQSFAEHLVAFDRGDKNPPDVFKSIIKRAQALTGGTNDDNVL